MSTYRNAPTKAAPSLTLACAKCGVFATIVKGVDAFRCSGCDLEQDALRIDADYAPASIRAVKQTEASYAELGRFAASVGVAARCAGISVACDGLVCDVSLSLNSGTVVGVDVASRALGLPPMELQRESPDVREAKQKGVTREVQTGDAAFDARVFIDSAADDEDILAVLAPPAVRAAILRLLEDCPTVQMGPAGVSATAPSDPDNVVVPGRDVFDPVRILASVASIRVLAGAPRPITPGAVKRDIGGIIAGTAFFGMIVVLMALSLLWSFTRPVGTNGAMTGAVAGLLLALVVQPLVRRAVSGRSDSHTVLVIARIALAIHVPLLSIGLLVGGNALFDRSPERSVDLVVESVSFDAEDKRLTAHARGTGEAASLGAREFLFDDPTQSARAGQRLTVRMRSGAFGWAWRSSPATLHVGRDALIEK